MGLDTYFRSAAIGASAGLRTFSAPAATLAAGGSAWTGIAIFVAAGELIFDKLPAAPSRLSPAGLGARIVSGGSCGAALADRADGSRTLGALCGAATAVASAFAGHSFRRYLTKTIGWSDLPIALIEDALAIGTARVANAVD
jgi:uncharacterized membrane protein